MKANAITAASEATCLLLSVDETVKNPRSDFEASFKDTKSLQVQGPDQFLPGPDRVRTRWEEECQEGWAEAGEDQCKTNQN